MRRRLVVLPGLATIAFGVWLLVRERAQNGVCNATYATTSSSALNRVCMRIVLSYFESFVFISAGLIITLLTAMALSKRSKKFKRVTRGQIAAVPSNWGASSRVQH
jgi:NADH:ubiquinone oxidoreductase subunit 6 (subunit J)